MKVLSWVLLILLFIFIMWSIMGIMHYNGVPWYIVIPVAGAITSFIVYNIIEQ